ncbi:hypothetical protein D3C81_833150 [compost metagenome]
MFYTGFKAGWGDNEGGGNVTQQQLLTYNKTRFEQSRAGACADKNIKAAGTIGAGAAVAATCMTSPSGVGAVACAGAVLAYAIGLHETDRSSKQCQASYPGIGNW